MSGADLAIAANTCGTQAAPVSLAPNQSCSTTVNWTPTAAGSLNGTLTFNATNALARSFTLTGTSEAKTFTGTLSPATFSFGTVTSPATATQTATLTNTGNSPLTFTPPARALAAY